MISPTSATGPVPCGHEQHHLLLGITPVLRPQTGRGQEALASSPGAGRATSQRPVGPSPRPAALRTHATSSNCPIGPLTNRKSDRPRPSSQGGSHQHWPMTLRRSLDHTRSTGHRQVQCLRGYDDLRCRSVLRPRHALLGHRGAMRGLPEWVVRGRQWPRHAREHSTGSAASARAGAASPVWRRAEPCSRAAGPPQRTGTVLGRSTSAGNGTRRSRLYRHARRDGGPGGSPSETSHCGERSTSGVTASGQHLLRLDTGIEKSLRAGRATRPRSSRSVPAGRRDAARTAGQRAGETRHLPRSSPAACARPSLRRSSARSPQGHRATRHLSAVRTGRHRVPLGVGNAQQPGVETEPFGSGRQQRGHPLPEVVRNKISTHSGHPAGQDRRARDAQLNSF